jgi:hypothetical protein
LAINRTYIFMNNTKVLIRATNMAREWMEMMFNIRDTNRRKYSWERDKYWLYLGSWNDESLNSFFQEWVYAIKEWKNGSWDRFVYAEKLNIWNRYEEFYDLEWFFSGDATFTTARSWAIVTFTWAYKYRSWSAETGTEVAWLIGDVLWNGVEFYRVARIYGIYKKDANESDVPANLDSYSYSEPKEMRFCVKVFYKLGAWNHSTELCSVMTNFME